VSDRTAGRLLVEQLEASGVERVYCVPGESYLEVLDALYDSTIRTVVCRQEGGAGFMAVAVGRLRGTPGVAMVTRGPGAANAAIAVHTAFQEFDLSGWFGTTAKKVLALDVPDRAADVVAEAFHIAASGRPGPVVVGLPEDVLVAVTDADTREPLPVGEGAVSPAQVDGLRRLLLAAHRPLVVVGGDRWTAASAARFTEWCERWRLPVAADFRAHDIVDHASPAYVGWLGFGRDAALAARLDEADLLLFVGCGAGDVLSDGYQLGRHADRVVVADLDPDLRTHQLRADLHLVASPAALVEALAGCAPPSEPAWPDRAEWAEWASSARAEQQRFSTPEPAGSASGVDLGAAMAVQRDRLPADAILTYGAGNHAVWPQRYLPHHGRPSVLAPRNGAMGFGLPAAVAASLNHPDRQVVTIAGDGCFLMNGQELATAAAVGARPLVLVVDNAMYGTIRTHQERAHPGRPSGTALSNPDFAAYARAFGGFGERVATTNDLPAALDRALAADSFALLHLLVDPDVGRSRPA
jgi:acetolactate synthase-1/2/3 large subunit